METRKIVTALDAVTATTTSPAIDIGYAKKVTLLFTRANHSAGSSTFTVDGSIDGTTYVALNTLIDNVTNTNAQTLTRVASSVLSSNTSKIYALDLENFGYQFIKVTCTEGTDGTHSASVLVEY